MIQRTYDFIVSIGSNCGCSGFLRRCKLQYASLPLDWNTGVSFEDNVKTILHDFEGFLDFENLQLHPKEKDDKDADNRCDYYKDTKTGYLFLHDFPIGVPLSESYPVVKEKYQRRINRLYNRIAKSHKVLFVWFCAYKWLDEAQIIKAQQHLAQKFFKQQVDLLIVENDQALSDIAEEHLSDNVIRIHYNMFSNKTGNPLSNVMGNWELGEQAFSRFKLRLPWWFHIVKKLIYFVPNRKVRKNLRRKLYNHD